jgi:enamine deaminase RidA (YjgF/YER057c/UK114 family)
LRHFAPLSLLFCVLLAACVSPHQVSRTIVLPSERHAKIYEEYQFAPAVRVGDTVFVSGIPAGPGANYEEKARNAFKRLGEILAASGASFDDVVEITTFHAQVTNTETFEAEFARLLAVHREFFKNGYPAWTAVGTTALLAPDAPFEMRAVAVIGAGKRTRIERTYERPR